RTELEVALRRTRSRNELEEVLRSATEDVERLSRLADDLLLLATADQTGLPIRREPLPVSDLFNRVSRRFAARSREQERTIDVADPDGLVVDADADRLEQALANLIDNALKYGAGTIRLHARARSTAVELHVEDEGRGCRRPRSATTGRPGHPEPPACNARGRRHPPAYPRGRATTRRPRRP